MTEKERYRENNNLVIKIMNMYIRNQFWTENEGDIENDIRTVCSRLNTSFPSVKKKIDNPGRDQDV